MTKHEFSLEKTRNIGITAHINTGKTITTECILYYTGKIHRIGKTHEGDNRMDWMEGEKKCGITIASTATTAQWKDYRVNIVDTPGHVGSTIGVERLLRVLDGTVTILDAQSGVEPQTENVWCQAKTYGAPRIVFVNKMGKVGTNFDFSVKTLHKHLNASVHAVQMPIGTEDQFESVIDLVNMVVSVYDEDKLGVKWDTVPVPGKYKEEIEKRRGELVKAVADVDDDIMGKHLGGEEITNEELKAAIRKATSDLRFFPIFTGSAFRNKGVQMMLDGVVDYLPSLLDVKPYITHDPKDDSEVELLADNSKPFAALAFKIATDPFVGRLAFIRVHTGSLQSGLYVLNASKNSRERVGCLFQMHANSRTGISEIFSGDITGTIGLKNTTTDNSLTGPDHPLILESLEVPDPVIRVSIESESKADRDKLDVTLQKFTEENPIFRTEASIETGQTLIAGMGELHLDIMVERMKREFHVEATIGEPQVAYRETFTKPTKAQGKFVRQSGGRGQYSDVRIEFTPIKEDEGYEFEDAIIGGVVPREFILSADAGLQEAMESGVLVGYPLIDVKVKLYDGSYHEIDFSEAAFKAAISLALKNAALKAGTVILEPVMKIQVIAPEEYLGDIIGSITARHGNMDGMEDRSGVKVLNAMVPLSEMFGYATTLRSSTQGRDIFTIVFNHYSSTPKSIQEEIIKKRDGNTE